VAEAPLLQTDNVEITELVEAGTVYISEVVVAAGEF
jgi:hypothetical protein